MLSVARGTSAMLLIRTNYNLKELLRTTHSILVGFAEVLVLHIVYIHNYTCVFYTCGGKETSLEIKVVADI